MISKDLFRDHIPSGFVSKEWVHKHVWGFMFVRGELVIHQLAPPPQLQGGLQRIVHLRLDDPIGTLLRKEPDAASVPLQDKRVSNGEEVKMGKVGWVGAALPPWANRKDMGTVPCWPSSCHAIS